MNERIKELALLAGYELKPFYKGEDGYQTPHFKDEKLEKFAELIVRECAGIYDKIDNGNLHIGTDNYLEALQKHFGVE